MYASACVCCRTGVCRRIRRASSDAPVLRRWFDNDSNSGAVSTSEQYSCFSTLVPDASERCVIAHDHQSHPPNKIRLLGSDAPTRQQNASLASSHARVVRARVVVACRRCNVPFILTHSFEGGEKTRFRGCADEVLSLHAGSLRPNLAWPLPTACTLEAA